MVELFSWRRKEKRENEKDGMTTGKNSWEEDRELEKKKKGRQRDNSQRMEETATDMFIRYVTASSKDGFVKIVSSRKSLRDNVSQKHIPSENKNFPSEKSTFNVFLLRPE